MLTSLLVYIACGAGDPAVPSELVRFTPHEGNPIFQPAGPGHWDAFIRERGWILRENDGYHLWYTGYDNPEGPMKLGYATSPDGIAWTRHPDNPIYTEHWVEDMMVVKLGDTYYMFAEGKDDVAHLLTSTDRVHWTRQGKLDVRTADGQPLSPGPYGTPTALYENGIWYLFYERNDEGIWLATSKDMKVWTNVQDDPVIQRGPERYDLTMLALNQIVKRGDRYYAFYHGTGPDNGPDRWTTNVAISPDLVRWEKYRGNPILGEDNSSAILVPDGDRFRLYSMHRAVNLYLPEVQP
jgi:predicted GH43/DUF377 family glycosyl hydrolase